MSEYSGVAGNIYTEKEDDEWECWFEDFCILGTGKTEIEALEDAACQAGSIVVQISDAIKHKKELANAHHHLG